MSLNKNLNFFLNSLVYSTPTPSSLSYLWNFGSLLGVCLLIQLVSGVFLSFHYSSALEHAFSSVVGIEEEVNWGWLIRSAHANGASLFFILTYVHVGRGLVFGGFKKLLTWSIGVVILLILMATAFMGYVLPWGQMSLWGATVITNLLSAIPYVGLMMVEWVWGGFSVSQPTLERFFALHFLLPMLIVVLVISHIVSLHTSGSSNPLGVDSNSEKVFFSPFFIVKDLLGVVFVSIGFISLCVLMGDYFMDPDNFIFANPLSTPPHIQPEWYFLFAYAILRSIPNKLGGVVALMMSILILLLLPFSVNGVLWKKKALWKFTCLVFFTLFFLLTWLGAQSVEPPFEGISQILSVTYFINLLLMIA